MTNPNLIDPDLLTNTATLLYRTGGRGQALAYLISRLGVQCGNRAMDAFLLSYTLTRRCPNPAKQMRAAFRSAIQTQLDWLKANQ